MQREVTRMKSNRMLAFLAVATLVALAAAPLGGRAVAGEKADLPEGQARAVIPVGGMTCGGCASAVTVAVKKLDGVVDVAVDREKGSATVTYERKKVTVDEIVAAINKAGYKATNPEKGEKKG
jgi:copper chaperone CopZ